MTNFKTLTVAAVAALGIAATPMPAAADGNDVAKVLGGLAALAIAAKVIDDRRDRRRDRAEQATRQSVFKTQNDGITLRRLDRDKGLARSAKIKRRPLPDRCLRVADTRRGDRLVYVSRCLDNNFRFASRLPDHCETSIRTRRGFRSVYGARCLSRDGWRVARR